MRENQINSKKKCVICQLVRAPIFLIKYIYIIIFARPSMQFINDMILRLALHGRGYNNCCDTKSTGEDIFIQLLSKKNPKLCIDIGANKGDYSRELLDKTNSKVIAFEPLPFMYNNLMKIKSVYQDRFVCINKGVGDKNVFSELYYSEVNPELASFSDEVSRIDYVGACNKEKILVEMITLDSFFKEYKEGKLQDIDLIKIDTEGYEYEVLVGCQETLAIKRPKFIQIEYNWHHLFRMKSLLALSEFLPGYKLFQLLPYGKGLVERDVSKPESNIYHYSNFVFVREDISLYE